MAIVYKVNYVLDTILVRSPVARSSSRLGKIQALLR